MNGKCQIQLAKLKHSMNYLEFCNTLCEYNILRNVIRQQCLNFDMTCSQYTSTNVVNSYAFHLGCHTITNKKCKLFHDY